MTDVIEVETDDTKLRQTFSLLLDPETDFPTLRATLDEAISEADGVCTDPVVEVLLVDIVNGEVEVQCRFWTGSRRREATAARHHAIGAAVSALARHDIALPVDELRVELTGGHADDSNRRRGATDRERES